MSYKSSSGLDKKIDSLPTFCPKFRQEKVMVEGETFKVFYRNILECIGEIYGRHALTPHLKFRPERHYADADMIMWIYGDVYTRKWWWEVQVSTTFGVILCHFTHLELRRPLRRKNRVRRSSRFTSHRTKHLSCRSWGNQYTPCM